MQYERTSNEEDIVQACPNTEDAALVPQKTPISPPESPSLPTNLASGDESGHHRPSVEFVDALVCGIAHDCRNLLAVVLTNANLLQQRLLGGRPPDSQALASIALIMDAGRRVETMTKRLLEIARKQPAISDTVELNTILSGLRQLLCELTGDRVILRFRPCQRPLHVRIGASQLEQILINLARNASDAMPEGGDLIFETSYHAPDDVGTEVAGTERAVAQAMVTVSDTGAGIGPEILGRVFEPFFTTKPRDRGMGLGLSVVQAILWQIRGHITVESVIGKGTTFRVFLPLAEPHLEA